MSTNDGHDDEGMKKLPSQDQRPFFSRVDFYLPLIIIGGLALALLFYASSLSQLGWADRPASASKDLAIANPFASPDALPVVLYISPTTEKYLTKVGGKYGPIIKQWRDFLDESKRPYQEAHSPQDIEKIGRSVLILPTSIALTDIERQLLLNHQERGGPIFATGPMGARDETGQWREWLLFNKLFQIQVTSEVASNSADRFLITTGESPISHAVPAGSRIWLSTSNESILQFAGGKPAGHVTDWARTPDTKGASFVYGNSKGTRWTVFGFSENSWDAQPYQLKLLVGNVLDWLQAKPVAFVGAWPNGFSAAQIITVDVEQSAENARNLANMLNAVHIKGTFFSLLGDDPSFAPLLDQFMTEGHELGFHGDTMAEFKDQTATEQKMRLDSMKIQFGKALRSASDISGFRAPGDSYDERTERALLSAGIRYHVTDANRTPHRLPTLAGLVKDNPEEDLMVIPRTQRDDISLLTSAKPTLAEMTKAFRADLASVQEQGALGVLSIHSQNFVKDSAFQQATGSMLFWLADRRKVMWLATAGEIDTWWRQRDALRTNLATEGSRQELRLSYYGNKPALNPTVWILHPYKSRLTLAPTRAWIPNFKIVAVDEYKSAVIFDQVSRGNYAYQAVFVQ